MSTKRDKNSVPSVVLENTAGTNVLSPTAVALTDSIPAHVAIVDSNGDQITSFGGGTQYTDGGVPPTHPVGNTIEWSDGSNWQTASTAKPLPVTATLTSTTITGTVAVTQSTSPWVVSNGGTFAVQATPVTQADTFMLGGVNIKEINAVTPLMGNGTTGTGSLRVTIASDNTAFSVNATPVTQADTFMLGGVNIKEINGVAPLMGSGTNGTGALRVTLATDQAATSVAGLFSVKVDQTTPGTTNAVSIAQVGATTVVNGGTAGSLSVGGMVANNGTINSAVNPILVGGQAVSSENAAGTTAKLGQFVTDLVGKQIVLPYANPENFVSGRATATDTTSTSLIGAPATGLRNYITQITVWNSSATSTYIKIQDGSGGTELYDIPAPGGGGATLTLPTPLRQPTTATAIYFAAAASANAVFVSASGYKGV